MVFSFPRSVIGELASERCDDGAVEIGGTASRKRYLSVRLRLEHAGCIVNGILQPEDQVSCRVEFVVKVQALVDLIEGAVGPVQQGVGAIVQPEPPLGLIGPNTELRAFFKHIILQAARVVPENVVVPAGCAVKLDN